MAQLAFLDERQQLSGKSHKAGVIVQVLPDLAISHSGKTGKSSPPATRSTATRIEEMERFQIVSVTFPLGSGHCRR